MLSKAWDFLIYFTNPKMFITKLSSVFHLALKSAFFSLKQKR